MSCVANTGKESNLIPLCWSRQWKLAIPILCRRGRGPSPSLLILDKTRAQRRITVAVGGQTRRSAKEVGFCLQG